MGNLLDQSEVDALLAAVDEGDVDLAGEKETKAGDALSDVVPYDFKRPERVSKDQMRSLENLHEVFARNLGATLSGMLRSLVDVKLHSIEQLTYAEFIMSLPNPTCFNVLAAPPLEGEMVLEINPSIIFPIIDRLLGGGKEDSTPLDRALTEIEQRISRKIIDPALERLKEIWARLQRIDFTLIETESNPQLRQIVPPNEVVVLVSFEITMGDANGMMNLCIPFAVIEPVMDRFAIEHIYNFTRKKPEAWERETLEDRLQDAAVEVVVTLARTELRVSELVALKPGDVIETAKPSGAPIQVSVEGKSKFQGKPCEHRGKKGVELTGAAGPHDHL